MDINAYTDNLKQFFAKDGAFVSSMLLTAAVFVFLSFVRFVVSRYVNRNTDVPLEFKRRRIVGVRNYTLLIFLISIVFIWGYQIKEFALSVAALAIAFVMSFKELIMNFMGGVSRAITHEFSVGDRIAIGNYRGDVVDTNMFSTTILEIGPGQSSHQYTGNTITFPNSMLLNSPVLNESFMQGYELHVFHIPAKLSEDWRTKERMILMAANEICQPYIPKARKYVVTKCAKLSVEPPSVEPRVSIIFKNNDDLDLIVRVPVPLRRKGKIEQEIVRHYLNLYDEVKNNENKEKIEKKEG